MVPYVTYCKINKYSTHDKGTLLISLTFIMVQPNQLVHNNITYVVDFCSSFHIVVTDLLQCILCMRLSILYRSRSALLQKHLSFNLKRTRVRKNNILHDKYIIL